MLLIAIHAAAVWFMAGSIWTMQVLNYPLLARIGPAEFADYETAHNRRFVAVVGPGTGVAALTTVLLLVLPPAGLSRAYPAAAAVGLIVVLVLTARFQAPAHSRLARGFDAPTHARLVRTNWARTAAWTVLGLLALVMVTVVGG